MGLVRSVKNSFEPRIALISKLSSLINIESNNVKLLLLQDNEYNYEVVQASIIFACHSDKNESFKGNYIGIYN